MDIQRSSSLSTGSVPPPPPSVPQRRASGVTINREASPASPVGGEIMRSSSSATVTAVPRLDIASSNGASNTNINVSNTSTTSPRGAPPASVPASVLRRAQSNASILGGAAAPKAPATPRSRHTPREMDDDGHEPTTPRRAPSGIAAIASEPSGNAKPLTTSSADGNAPANTSTASHHNGAPLAASSSGAFVSNESYAYMPPPPADRSNSVVSSGSAVVRPPPLPTSTTNPAATTAVTAAGDAPAAVNNTSTVVDDDEAPFVYSYSPTNSTLSRARADMPAPPKAPPTPRSPRGGASPRDRTASVLSRAAAPAAPSTRAEGGGSTSPRVASSSAGTATSPVPLNNTTTIGGARRRQSTAASNNDTSFVIEEEDYDGDAPPSHRHNSADAGVAVDDGAGDARQNRAASPKATQRYAERVAQYCVPPPSHSYAAADGSSHTAAAAHTGAMMGTSNSSADPNSSSPHRQQSNSDGAASPRRTLKTPIAYVRDVVNGRCVHYHISTYDPSAAAAHAASKNNGDAAMPSSVVSNADGSNNDTKGAAGDDYDYEAREAALFADTADHNVYSPNRFNNHHHAAAASCSSSSASARVQFSNTYRTVPAGDEAMTGGCSYYALQRDPTAATNAHAASSATGGGGGGAVGLGGMTSPPSARLSGYSQTPIRSSRQAATLDGCDTYYRYTSTSSAAATPQQQQQQRPFVYGDEITSPSHRGGGGGHESIVVSSPYVHQYNAQASHNRGRVVGPTSPYTYATGTDYSAQSASAYVSAPHYTSSSNSNSNAALNVTPGRNIITSPSSQQPRQYAAGSSPTPATKNPVLLGHSVERYSNANYQPRAPAYSVGRAPQSVTRGEPRLAGITTTYE